jgi:hypothetical protein
MEIQDYWSEVVTLSQEREMNLTPSTKDLVLLTTKSCMQVPSPKQLCLTSGFLENPSHQGNATTCSCFHN